MGIESLLTCTLFSFWFKFCSTFLGRGSISIAHLLVPVGVTTAHFPGGDHITFSLALPFVPCFGSTSTIYPLMIEEVELTASLALLRPLLFSSRVKTTNGSSRPLVFVFPVRTTWSLTPLRVPNKDTPIDVPVSSEDLTWSLTFVRVPISSEDSLSHQSTLVLYFSSPLHHDAFEKELELELEFLSSIKRPILTYGTRVYMCS